MTSLGRLPRSSAATPPLEDDDLLFEILLLLPPEPSSLPRASVVCKRWHRLITDPHFICRFRRHHRRNPPLLGFFNTDRGRISFQPIMEAPNRFLPERFSLQLDDEDGFKLLGCRHGLVLLLLVLAHKQKQVLVWDPVTGDQHRIAVPTVFYMNKTRIQGAVLRAAGEVHNFQVVLVAAHEDDKQHRQVLASTYLSETGIWGNPISKPLPPEAYTGDYFTNVCMPDVLVGDSLYWPLNGNYASSSYILEFNLERQSLAMIELPVEEDTDLTAMRAEGGGLGFLCLSESDFSAQLWKRKTDRDGVTSWVLGRTIELDKLLSLNSKEGQYLMIIGFAEYNNVVFLAIGTDLFMVDLESLQLKKLFITNSLCHPFETVHTLPSIYVNLDMKMGSAWWLLHGKITEEVFYLSLPLSEFNFSEGNVILHSMFCLNPDRSFGTTLFTLVDLNAGSNPHEGMNANALFGLCSGPLSTMWKIE
ncbi:hypothetical protein QYE76_019693 [Lolium multiflorum]|uniref:F-box domain-containing protein n=1 Tax=Lolium multiflorum TaxID=4521 RepID=A0AAD8R4F6_LOLMU|nr:hypothetical protein QYE76_019693 [Lolium multiflorum]